MANDTVRVCEPMVVFGCRRFFCFTAIIICVVLSKCRGREMKIFTGIITVGFVLLVISSVLFGCISTEQVEEKAYNDVLEELRANGNPTGMFGVTWYMTQQDVNETFDDCYQLSSDTLAHEMFYCDRPVQVSYHFTDDRLFIIIVTFNDEFSSLEEFSEAFYRVQDCLSSEYGQMLETIMHESIPPVNDKWEDQDLLESEKRMGRIHLIHQITIKDNAAGEQILMFLGEKES